MREGVKTSSSCGNKREAISIKKTDAKSFAPVMRKKSCRFSTGFVHCLYLLFII